MATTYPGIGNANNWITFMNQSKTAEKLSDNTYRPIEKFVSGSTLEGKLIAINCDSSSAPPHYRNAGWLTQVIFTGVSTGGTVETRIDKSWLLLLRRVNLIIPNPSFPDYGVIIDVPYWYDDIQITGWQYTGPDSDLTTNQLASMDVKLDQILMP